MSQATSGYLTRPSGQSGKGYGSPNAKRGSAMSVDSLSITPRISSGCYMGPPITAVSINRSLLTPLKLDIDPSIQAVRTKEKDQIKGLNNRFASFINKVQLLEQQNKMLETKWNLLENQTTGPSTIEPLFKNYIGNLQMQLQQIENDRDRLEMENNGMHRNVEEYKTKYEDEINRRNGAENEFVCLKKDVDSGYLSKIDLEDRVSSLMDEVHFLKAMYNEELRELQEDMKEISVVVQMDNSRTINMSQTMDEVKAQYEGIAARSREEAESWYRTKFDQMSAQSDKYGEELRSDKSEMAELNRMIARLQSEIAGVEGQRSNLENQITEVEERGEQAAKDARYRIKDLEQALRRAKQDMARQLKEYQELMNIKLALDIEISTYRKLLEGEEGRIGLQSITNIQNVPSYYNPMVVYSPAPQPIQPMLVYSPAPQPIRKVPSVIIKMVETQDSSTSYN